MKMQYILTAVVTAFFLSSGHAEAKGDVNVGIRSYWAGDNNPLKWGHSLPRSTIRGSDYSTAAAPETPSAFAETQAPVPYLIDISKMLDPYVWIFNKPVEKQIQWFKKRSDNPWPSVVAGIASAFIAGGCMLLPFALTAVKTTKNKRKSV